MNITFLVGNGFDLNLGLKTRYVDFYPYFKEHAKEDNMIKKWLTEDEQLWADMEEGLGKELGKLKEEEIENFYDDKGELDSLLTDYLEIEQEKYKWKDDKVIKDEIQNSILKFSDDLSEEGKRAIKKTIEKYRNEEYTYIFVSFNYTKVLDKMVELFKDNPTFANHRATNGSSKADVLGKVIHIHGTIEQEMILGVNDEKQVENNTLIQDEIFLNTIIKKRMNLGIGQRKTENVINVIDESHIICIFGMSLGNTDKMWWEELVRWLLSNGDNKLVIFYKGYEKELKKRLPSTVIRIDYKLKKKLYEAGKGNYSKEEFKKIQDRIFISYNSRIFSFPRLT